MSTLLYVPVGGLLHVQLEKYKLQSVYQHEKDLIEELFLRVKNIHVENKWTIHEKLNMTKSGEYLIFWYDYSGINKNDLLVHDEKRNTKISIDRNNVRLAKRFKHVKAKGSVYIMKHVIRNDTIILHDISLEDFYDMEKYNIVNGKPVLKIPIYQNEEIHADALGLCFEDSTKLRNYMWAD
ncbi:MAG: hypothetical protein H0U27_14600 [Nitrosopumilus sp.]|nr:hypothetical protein [Nitrosopumilus sp.]